MASRRARTAKPASPALPPYAIETWPIERLKPYERNPRTHSKAQIEQLRSSFARFGQVWPILARADGTIIAGHGRIEAAKLEELTEVRVIVANGWSEGQCRAFGLLDNRVALNSEWDEELLSLELSELSTGDIPLGDLGFGEDELADLLSGSEPAERASGTGTAIIQFNIVFDDEIQQQAWFTFVRTLKTKYPDEETLGARLARHLAEQPVGQA